jgi:hypothetical protein
MRPTEIVLVIAVSVTLALLIAFMLGWLGG